MSTFYAEIRRQDALERLQLKKGLPFPDPDPIVVQIKRKVRRELQPVPDRVVNSTSYPSPHF